MKIEIIKAYNGNIWYANRIGQTFDAKKVLNGYIVNSHPLFFINSSNAKQINIPFKKTKYNYIYSKNTISLLPPGVELAGFEIHQLYCETFEKVKYRTIECAIQNLRRGKRIERCKEKVKNPAGRINYKWKIKV